MDNNKYNGYQKPQDCCEEQCFGADVGLFLLVAGQQVLTTGHHVLTSCSTDADYWLSVFTCGSQSNSVAPLIAWSGERPTTLFQSQYLAVMAAAASGAKYIPKRWYSSQLKFCKKLLTSGSSSNSLAK
jgi:hypothetical protein